MSNKIVFLHIEKAAGSTIHDIMYANFFPYYVASPVKYEKGEDNQKKQLEKKQLGEIFRRVPRLKAAGGHSLRCYGGNEPDIFYFSFLREPTSRYLSHYFYQKEVMGVDRSFEEFLDDGYFNNFMCRKISGESNADAAIDVIKKKEVLLCLVERFDESLEKLANFLADKKIHNNFQAGYQVSNSRDSRNGGRSDELEELKTKYRDRILLNNREDIKLYEYAGKAYSHEGASKTPLKMKSTYPLRIKIGKFLRRVLFIPLERKVGFDGV